MSVNGNAEGVIKLSGKLSIPDKIHGKSAYEIAVMHGFNGTEGEWLESIGGKKYINQEPQADGSFAFEEGKVYKIYSPKEGGKFTCEIQLATTTGDMFKTIVNDIPFVNTADSFLFELLDVENEFVSDQVGMAANVSYKINNVEYSGRSELGSMSLYNYGIIKGATKVKIVSDVADGKSAYEMALEHDFEGTEEEWLASLKGEKPIKGTDYFTEADIESIVDEIVSRSTARAKIGNVTLLANDWGGAASPYSQVVTVEGATENSQVDLTPSVEQLAIFHEKDLAFVTENEDGVVTVYAIGQKPTNDYTIQVTITEVAV